MSSSAEQGPRSGGRSGPESPDVRALILGWCMWLLGSWGVALTIDATSPAVRWMIMSALVGMTLIWPAVRLSQGHGDLFRCSGRSTLAAVLLDWIALVLVIQAVLWPLRIMAEWSMAQVCFLNGALAAWSCLTGVLIAWGRQFQRAAGRSLAMLFCLLLMLGEPAMMVLADRSRPAGFGWTMRVSPIQTVWALTVSPTKFTLQPWASHVIGAAVAAVVGWLILGACGRWK